MWLFSGSNKNGDSANSQSQSFGLSFATDPVPGYCIDQSNSQSYGPISASYGLEWLLYCGIKRKSKQELVTLFKCSLRGTFGDSELSIIGNSLTHTIKWFKTLRHPNILNWIAGLEPNLKKLSEFYFVTERVIPLRDYLKLKADCGNFNLMSSWGIHQIAKALIFLNDDCKLTHNAVRMDAVFVTSAGEWKLGNLDFVCPTNERSSAGRSAIGASESDPYLPTDGTLVDSWGLGCLIWELFNPNTKLADRSQLTNSDCIKRLPKQLVSHYRRLIGAGGSRTATRRLTVAKFFQAVRNSDKEGFLANDYVDTLLFLEEIQLKDAQEKIQFLNNLTQHVTSFPDDVCRHKILPHLVHGLSYGSAGIDGLLPVLRLIPLISSTDFETTVLPCLLKLFASNERLTRVKLLEQLPNYVQHLSNKVVEGQIFGSISVGFTDTNPIVREASLRAMIHLAPKLSAKVLNDVLIKHLITLQTRDEQGGIRTNATICMAKLATLFSVATQQGAMLNAFLRATRDPFLPSRKAALTALIATQDLYSNEMLAGKLLPCLAFLTVDADKSTRDDTFRALRNILDRLEQDSECLDDKSANADETGKSINNTTTNSTRTASALSQWAISALSFSTRFLPASTNSDSQSCETADRGTGGAAAVVEVNSSRVDQTEQVSDYVNHQPTKKPMNLKAETAWDDDLEEIMGDSNTNDGWTCHDGKLNLITADTTKSDWDCDAFFNNLDIGQPKQALSLDKKWAKKKTVCDEPSTNRRIKRSTQHQQPQVKPNESREKHDEDEGWGEW